MFSQAVVGGIWLAMLGISSTIPATLAQDSSNVTCMSSFYWANNDMGQNPCIVASYLDTQCPPTGFTIEPVSAGIPYEPPAGALANACECNTVLYSLMSACAACQGATHLSWASWTQACNETSSSLPMGIPPGTAVPAWAFIGIDAGGTWNETAALLNAC
ncbi:hypothetical protein HYDPIDRAFT_34996 [Hydnomerulius pinastri MD-312]|uniref:Uncharacterized protein n=1 Tax=Hydnomerulius pinastri MD-312 TaxID=994086 RepID=A0A0C2PR70_9AGAM|nr:hypothetical protein HYDPIDRAFT_34996 [Hydnomerulius pinastri MD-312]